MKAPIKMLLVRLIAFAFNSVIGALALMCVMLVLKIEPLKFLDAVCLVIGLKFFFATILPTNNPFDKK